jgi:hypothetical protein
MVLWRPGLRLNAPGVEFPLHYRDLDRYSANELQLFIREATRVHGKCESSRQHTRTSLKQLLSSINIAWDIIDERRAARRIPVFDLGCATTRTVYVRPSSGEEHIYLSPWTYADPGRSIDNDSEWSSAAQSNESEQSTGDEQPRRKRKQQTKPLSKEQTKVKGRAQRHDQRKKPSRSAKNGHGSILTDESEDDSERPHVRTHSNRLFDDSRSSGSELPRRHTRTNKNEVRGKAKGEGHSKSKSKPVAPKIDQHDQTLRSLNEPGHAASYSRGYSSTSSPYKVCTDRHNNHRQTSNRPRSTLYSYTGSQLGSAARSKSMRPSRQRPGSHEQQHDVPQASNTVHEPPKTSPSQITPPTLPSKFNPYIALSLPPTSTIATIKATVRTLSLRFYPDKQHGKPDAEIQDAYDRMCEVNNAKDTLLDEIREKAYDQNGVVEEADFEEWLEKQKP